MASKTRSRMKNFCITVVSTTAAYYIVPRVIRAFSNRYFTNKARTIEQDFIDNKPEIVRKDHKEKIDYEDRY